MPKRNTHN